MKYKIKKKKRKREILRSFKKFIFFTILIRFIRTPAEFKKNLIEYIFAVAAMTEFKYQESKRRREGDSLK